MTRLKDIFAILRPLAFILLFQLVILIALHVNQGRDMMLLVLEDMLDGQYNLWLWFLVALFFWSVVSEYGCRIILYLSDVSAHHLNPERVEFRKKVVGILKKVSLAGPCLISASALFTSTPWKQLQPSILINFMIALASLALMAYLLYQLYYGRLSSFSQVEKEVAAPEARGRLTKLTGILQETYLVIQQNAMLPPGNRFQRREGNYLITRFTIGDFQPVFNRLYALIAASVSFIILFCVMPSSWHTTVGGLAIVTLGLACWLTIYYAIEFLYKAQPFRIRLPYKLLAVTLLLFSSWRDNDHPVRQLPAYQTSCTLPPVNEHFKEWVAARRQDTTKKSLPVIFIAAEGGALRTGALTAMMLARLDSIPGFREHIYAFSTVSGGTLGANFYAALTHSADSLGKEHDFVHTKTKTFFSMDFLSGATGRLMFGEILNYFVPFRISWLDRARALEESWEQGFANAAGANTLAGSFDDFYCGRGSSSPAIFIHTTEVETGSRTIFSNVRGDGAFTTAKELHPLLAGQLRYSTAIGLSARFPIVSPSAAISQGNNIFHYVDGGYYENRGATTLTELLLHLKTSPAYTNIDPYVILFSFGDSEPDSAGKRFMDEISSILSGIYNTRGGHTRHATEKLKAAVPEGHFIEFASADEIPMNWVFSRRTINAIDTYCGNMMTQGETGVFVHRLKEVLK